MGAKSTKGVQVYLTPSEATEKDVLITSIIAGVNKSIVINATFLNPPKVGDVVMFGSTGFASLSNKPFAITTITGGALSLEKTPDQVAPEVDAKAVGNNVIFTIGNVTLGSGSLASGATLEHFEQSTDICLCLSQFSLTKDTPATISVGTYCDPSASIPSSSTSAGSVAFAGFVDVTQPDYPELLRAEESRTTRTMVVRLPQAQGFIVLPFVVSSIIWDIPLDGALAYSGTGTLTSNAVHNF
jgi:hypothetical protein